LGRLHKEELQFLLDYSSYEYHHAWKPFHFIRQPMVARIVQIDIQ
jgi:hypothetical protein